MVEEDEKLSKKPSKQCMCRLTHCQVTHDGRLYSWGASACGQLGQENVTCMPRDVEGYPYQPVPLPIRSLPEDVRIVRISCGDAHTAALSSDGRVFTWGGGGCGQLGQRYSDGLSKDEDGCPFQPVPKRVAAFDTVGPIAKIACGKAHTVCCSVAKNLYSFGAGACGQLGIQEIDAFVFLFVNSLICFVFSIVIVIVFKRTTRR